jgi:hypothetical protein
LRSIGASGDDVPATQFSLQMAGAQMVSQSVDAVLLASDAGLLAEEKDEPLQHG